MSSEQKPPSSQHGLPCSRIKDLASRNRTLRSILEHMHVLQIIDDHQAIWLEASDESERREIEKRLRVQLFYAFTNFFGMEVTVHGLVAIIATEPLYGGSLVIVGLGIMYLSTMGKGR